MVPALDGLAVFLFFVFLNLFTYLFYFGPGACFLAYFVVSFFFLFLEAVLWSWDQFGSQLNCCACGWSCGHRAVCSAFFRMFMYVFFTFSPSSSGDMKGLLGTSPRCDHLSRLDN